MNFVKLKNHFIFDTESLVVDESTSFISHGPVNYYNVAVPKKIKCMMYSVIPIEFHKFFYVFYMGGGGNLAPHTEQTSSCTILFYNNPGNFKTGFYELINKNTEPMKSIPSNINTDVKKLPEKEYSPIVYRDEDLKLIDSYIAQPNEAWCVNGKIIHSVSTIDNSITQTRSALALDTGTLSFEIVVELLNQTNSI